MCWDSVWGYQEAPIHRARFSWVNAEDSIVLSMLKLSIRNSQWEQTSLQETIPFAVLNTWLMKIMVCKEFFTEILVISLYSMLTTLPPCWVFLKYVTFIFCLMIPSSTGKTCISYDRQLYSMKYGHCLINECNSFCLHGPLAWSNFCTISQFAIRKVQYHHPWIQWAFVELQ